MTTEVVRAVREVVGSTVPVGVRISQGKVNDFLHKWPEAEQGTATLFTALAGSAIDYIHVTEMEAWRPAFTDVGPTLVRLTHTYAPEVTIIANGNLQDPVRAVAALVDCADLIALGRGALSNPD